MSLQFKLIWALFCVVVAVSFDPLVAVGLVLAAVGVDEIVRRFGGHKHDP
jgi:hypothetical protein